MKRIALFILIAAIVTSPAVGQADVTVGKPEYSESISYQPRTRADLDRKKKKKGKDDKLMEPAKPLAMSVHNSFPLYVAVMDNMGKMVTDLKQNDFTVFVDDTEAVIDALKIPDEAVTVILLVDISPSAVSYDKNLKEYVWEIIKEFRSNDLVSVMGFGSKLEIMNEPTKDRGILLKSIDKLQMDDGTSLYETMTTLFDPRLNQIPGTKAVVILTDGVDTTSQGSDYVSSLEAAERIGWPVFPVYLDTVRHSGRGNRSGIDAQIMDMILRSQTGRTSGLAKEYERGRQYLKDLGILSGGRIVDRSKPVQTTISDQLSRRYLLNVKPNGGSRIGERRRIRVRVNRPGLTIFARGSYIAD